MEADVVVVGSGLAGLVATAQIAEAGRRVVVLDQEPEASLGGQAQWSLGGLFMVNTPEQRRWGVRDDRDLAMHDWCASAEFRAEDVWPRRWAEAYVDWAAGEMRPWLRRHGVRFLPFVEWAERGGHLASGPGSSVPRFHVAWGTGPGVLEPFLQRVRAAEREGRVQLRFRHRVESLTTTGGRVDGCAGVRMPGGEDFEVRAQAVVVASGGMGGNHDLIRRGWPQRYGAPPEDMLSGVPDHVDGRMLEVARRAGANLTNIDRMWNYPEGVGHFAPRWSHHGVRILAGPSSLWLDAFGRRLPPPYFPVFDTLGAYERIVESGRHHSWFLLNHAIASKELALSGSEHNPDITERNLPLLLKRGLPRPVAPVAEFIERCPDFLTAGSLPDLVAGMNELAGEPLVDAGQLQLEVEAYDRRIATRTRDDAQLQAIGMARRHLPDRLLRICRFQRILDPSAAPLIAIRLRTLTRKSLGGVQTDLSGRVLTPAGTVLDGVYAAGEVAGFGGGGMHGRRSMEGTFLGGCLHSGRVVATAIQSALA